MSVVDLGEVQLFVTDTGPLSGVGAPPVLLVHGWTCDSHDWSDQLDSLATRHRVIAPDLRGHGRSSTPAAGYTAQHHAADLVALLDRLDVGPVVVIGHSLGAVVAAALAVEHPERVLATVVVEPAYGQPPPALEWLVGVADQFGTQDGNALAADLQAATEPTAPARQRAWHRRRTLGMAPALLARTFRDMYVVPEQVSGQPATDRYLAGRRCPTLAFHRLPDMADWERGVLTHPASRAVSWEGSGHWLHQERPVEFNRLVLDWLADLPVAGHPADRPALQGTA
ncbi:alpha/beta fold hydrolase [Modestobacter sp. I12A-02628]|uniref:Alpha/beta hydrolase n=1 Tax=Goekera deserti TaxID=2497753 RepID=A0A7K3WHN2_9ACTN|nr:alpha/beta hydrolase [Goekera deserti]MPQ96484.1 alpha/beta fold hydrolase [Goekera deserti]NDI47201.1 alpha/beta fold hydrolase [Goekera deserti]NEL55399.1 alpha/beta hydrolase [Goekera deserti]